jgi:hypothetical protein
MGVERCSSLASTGRYRTQGLNQVKEFEKLLYESGTTIPKFFLHISKDEEKERLGWASRGGAAMTPFPHFFFYLGYVMWKRPRSSVGSNSPAATITASFFRDRFPGIRRSQWVCFMLNESMQGKLISPLTRFPNGRKRKLRPIHSLDQGDWTGRAVINGFPRQLSKRGG